MSPWPHKELQVVLCPDRVTLLSVQRRLTLRGPQRSCHDPQTVFVEPAAGAPPWQPALAALETALPASAQGRTAATVILANQFLRYVVVPWRAELVGAEEDLSYARHCFAKVYGKPGQQWEVRVSQQPPGWPRLASAIDPELLEGLRNVFGRAGVRMRSIQPHLMAAFNGVRGQLRHRSAWLALAEPGHVCLALLREGQWSSVRSLRVGSPWREEIVPILERACFVADDAVVPQEVYVGTLETADETLPDVEPWHFHALGPASLLAGEPLADGHAAMVASAE